jgi:tripartite-type tricarboxylate transporter receptor subunit TctC
MSFAPSSFAPGQFLRTVALTLALVLVPIGTLTIPGRTEGRDYPNRQVNFVVPFAPGGGTDILGRIFGQKLSDRFGTPFVVENRPGAGTVTGAAQVARSAPDGYTIMMATSSTLAINASLYKKLPYEPGKDLIMAALICNVPFVLVVNPDLPVHSVADLVRLAKEKPLSFGSGGAGAFHHLMGELFKTTMGIPMTHVPYKGTLPALNDVIAGHIQLMFSDLAPAFPLIEAGKVRALGVTTAQRAASAPNIPPLRDVGVPGFDWAAWQSVAVPGATPPEIVAKLNSAINEAAAQSDVTKQLVDLQFTPVGKGSPAELERFVTSETARWAKVVQQAGVAGSE